MQVSFELSSASPANAATAWAPITMATTLDMGCFGIIGFDQDSQTAPYLFAAMGLPPVFSVQLNCVLPPASVTNTTDSNVSTAPFNLVPAGTLTLGGAPENAHVIGTEAAIPLAPIANRVVPNANQPNPQGYPVNITNWWQFDIESVVIDNEVVAGHGLQVSSTSSFPCVCHATPRCVMSNPLPSSQDITSS
jgi:hypothetical protein